MRYSSVVAPLVAASALLSSAARAEPPREAQAAPSAELAMMAGAASAMIPITLGSALASSGTDDGAKDVGLVVVGAGFALAPLVSHAVLGEWKRAAMFTAIPLATEIGMAALVSARADAVFHGTTLSRTTFGALLCVDVFFSALGVVDAALASNQSPKGRWFGSRGVVVAPTIAAGRVGLTVGGAL